MAESTSHNKDTASSINDKVVSFKDKLNQKVEESSQEWAAQCPECGSSFWSIIFDGGPGMAEHINGFKCAQDDCLYFAPVKIDLEKVEIDINGTQRQ